MSVLLIYFVAIAISIIFNKKFYETIVGAILIESLVLYLSDYIFKSLSIGLYLIYAINIVAILFCVYCIFAHLGKLKKCIVSPESLMWIAVVAFFALTNLGRGLSSYDDFICWGLRIKDMYLYDQIYAESATAMGHYPPATMCWCYLACKTWPFGYTDSAILWAYDVYIIACLLPLFRLLEDKKNVIYYVIIVGIILLLPLSLTTGTDQVVYLVYEWLCADVLLGLLAYYGIFMVYCYEENGDLFYVYQLYLILYAITLTKRIGISWTVFPLLILTNILMHQNKMQSKRQILILVVAYIVPMLSYYTYDRISINIFIPFVTIPASFIMVYWTECVHAIKKHWKLCVVIFFPILFVVHLVINKISEFPEYTGEIKRLFFDSVFSNLLAGYGTLIKIPLFGFVLLSLACAHVLFKRDNDKSEKIDLLYALIIAVILNLAVLFCAYLQDIGLDPYWKGLPAYERYVGPYYLLILLWFAERALSNGNKKYLIAYCLIFVLEFVNISSFTDFIYGKTPQLEYPGLDNSNVVLSENDKVYYVNTSEDHWSSAGFYYYIAPATCSFEGIIGYDRNNDTVKLSAKEFENALIEGEYNYLYIKNLYDAFINNYSCLFENANDIHDNSFYQINIVNGRVRIKQL